MSKTSLRRTQIKIISEIIEFASKPRRPTHIMHQMNLNYAQLKNYLSWLVDKELLEVIREPYRVFRTTPKGLEFMQMLEIGKSNQEEPLSVEELNFRNLK